MNKKHLILSCFALCMIVSSFTSADQERSDYLFAQGVELYNKKQYSEAIPLFYECDSIDKLNPDIPKNRRYYAAMWLASCHYQLGDTASAKTISPSYYRFVPIDRRLTMKSDSLSDVGLQLIDNRDYPRAEDCILQCAEIEREVIGEKHILYAYTLRTLGDIRIQKGDPSWQQDVEGYCDIVGDNYGYQSYEYADALYILASYYNYAKNYAEAITFCKKALEIFELNVGNKHRDYAICLHKLATLHAESGNLEEAIKMETEVAGILRETVGPESADYADTLNILALFYSEYNNDEEALKICSEAFSIIERNFEKEDPKYRECLQSLMAYNSYTRNYTEAIRLGKEALCINERTIGKENPDYASLLNRVSLYYAHTDNYKDAAMLCEEALNIRERVLGKDHPHYLSSLDKLACYKASLGQIHEAINLGEELLHLKERLSGKDNPEYASTLCDVCQYFYVAGRFKNAVRLGTEALEIRARLLGKEHPDYIASLDQLATIYKGLGNYTEEEKLRTEVLAITDRTLGKENEKYTAYLSNFALCCKELGKFDEAIQSSSEALEIAERIFGKDNLTYVGTLLAHGQCISKRGNNKEALRLSMEGIDIIEHTVGRNHPYYGGAISQAAEYYSYLGNYQEALRLFTESMENAKKWKGEEHPDYVQSLKSIGDTYEKLGNYKEALRLYTEAINIMERTLGKEHPEYATLLNQIALVQADLGNYIGALRNITESLEITARTEGKEHPHYVTSLNNLALFYSELGNYSEAIGIQTEVLGLAGRIYGTEHRIYARYLDNLACYQARLKNYDEAIKLGGAAVKIWEKTEGKQHPDYALSMTNLSVFYTLAGNHTEALRQVSEALDIRERTIGKEHPNYYNSLYALSRCHSAMGNHNEAINAGIQALENSRLNFGSGHPNQISVTIGLINEYYATDNKEETVRLSTDLNTSYSEQIRKTFSDLTAEERKHFWEENKTWFETIGNRVAFKFQVPELNSIGYDATLMAKGILLNSERDFSDIIRESNDEESTLLYNQLRTLHLTIDRLYDKPVSERSMNIDSLENEARGIERNLLQRSKAYGDFTHDLTIGWKDVKKNLKSGDLAIEFVSFPIDSDRTIYSAYVISPTMDMPEMVTIFDAKDLSKIPSSVYYTSDKLSSLVWSSLDPYLSTAKNIYFSPAGELYNIAIESLPDYKGTGQLSDRLNFRRLSSTRELAAIKGKNKIRNVALYGGITYDTDVQTLQNDATRYPSTGMRDIWTYSLPEALGLRGGVTHLPATELEVNDIGETFSRTNIRPAIYTGSDGTEASFNALSGKGMNLIHVATHGFYWTESEAKRMTTLDFLQLGDGKHSRHAEDKALSRSGLLFAGANNTLSGKNIPEGIPDGILTAKEISTLDLRGLDMIVMSACQTGLGEITGDGVFGLQRGFKKAGANSMLMSLWKVDDRATQMLMSRFYKELLSGQTKQASLLIAQKHVREFEEEVADEDYSEATASQKRRNRLHESSEDETSVKKIIRPFKDPKYWAAFILLDALD